MPRPDVALRATPQQARSQATRTRILEVSASLLEEVGLEGFNTNLLAERAGVGVRAIYRYFPNKWAILMTLNDRLRDLERAWIGDLEAFGASVSWRTTVADAIDGYYREASRYPGYAALRAASLASPEIQALEGQHNRELERMLARGLRRFGVECDEPRLNALCRTIIEACNRILDIALQSDPDEACLLVDELKRMVTNLLADYVEPQTPHGAHRTLGA